MDDSQPFPPDDVGQNVDSDKQAMELDPEDNPPPLPWGRPTDAPVAAASAPQGALQLMAAGARQSQGVQGRFRMVSRQALGSDRSTAVVPNSPWHTHYASPGESTTVSVPEATTTTTTSRMENCTEQGTQQPVQKLF